MATIPSGIIVGYDGTNASIPSGWTRVTSLDGRYHKGTAAGVDPAVTGGAATHSHVDPGHGHTVTSHTHTGGTSDGTGTVNMTSGVTPGMYLATHTHTSGTSGAVSPTATDAGIWQTAGSEPGYYAIIWIQSNGSPTGFPANAVVYFNSATTPTSWTQHAASEGLFLKGVAAAGDAGATAALAAHTHTANAHTHAWNAHTHTGGTSGSFATNANIHSSGSANPDWIATSHTHPYVFDAGSTSANTATSAASGSTSFEPPHFKLAANKNTSGGASLPTAQLPICLWLGTLGTVPSGWTLCDGTDGTPDLRGKFVKATAAASGDLGATGGAAGHSHTDPAGHTHSYDHTHVVTFGGTSHSGGLHDGGGDAFAVDAHAHSATSGGATGTSGSAVQTAPSTTDTQPPFMTVAYIQLGEALTVTNTGPTNASTVVAPAQAFTWTYSSGSGNAQADYELKIFLNDGVTQVYDSGMQAGAAVTFTTPSSWGSGQPVNNTTYKWQIFVHSTAGTASQSSQWSFTTSWTPPVTVGGLTVTPIGAQ